MEMEMTGTKTTTAVDGGSRWTKNKSISSSSSSTTSSKPSSSSSSSSRCRHHQEQQEHHRRRHQTRRGLQPTATEAEEEELHDHLLLQQEAGYVTTYPKLQLVKIDNSWYALNQTCLQIYQQLQMCGTAQLMPVDVVPLNKVSAIPLLSASQ